MLIWNLAVKIVFFTKQVACEYCDEIDQLIGEVAELSDLINVEILDYDGNPDLAEEYNVLYAPTLVILAQDGETSPIMVSACWVPLPDMSSPP